MCQFSTNSSSGIVFTGKRITAVNKDDKQSKKTDKSGAKIGIFDSRIPMSVRAAETSAEGKSIYIHDPRGKVAKSYEELTEEVLVHE